MTTGSLATEDLAPNEMYLLRTHVDERVYLGVLEGMNHRVDPTRIDSLRPLGRLGRANDVQIRDIETVLRSDGPNE